jgi:hypothetical protein
MTYQSEATALVWAEYKPQQSLRCCSGPFARQSIHEKLSPLLSEELPK